MFASWSYAFAYSLQLYFDFSGYSDMAIGLAYMFGIRFPINFDSPYKSQNIIDFWQRFHITLTRYLTLLLYNPLALRITRYRMRVGGGATRRDKRSWGLFGSQIMVPTFYTMGIAGIWHGAGLQYLLFGLMHGTYLTINHAWRMFGPKLTVKGNFAKAGIVVCKVAITYVAVVAALVMFRASSVGGALQMMAGMLGLHGVDAVPMPSFAMTALRHLGPVQRFLTETHHILAVAHEDSVPGPASLAFRFFIVWALPNSQTIMARFSPISTAKLSVPQWLSWRPTPVWAVALGALLAVSIMSLQQTKVFLYFQF
jgi:alginate O-acetyltransferase complex protein AlgI